LTLMRRQRPIPLLTLPAERFSGQAGYWFTGGVRAAPERRTARLVGVPAFPGPQALFPMDQASPAAGGNPPGPLDSEWLPWQPLPVPARTDAGRPILLYTLRGTATQLAQLLARAEQQDEHMRRAFAPSDGLIRTSPPDLSYNCHGWIFAAGRCYVEGPDVEAI